MGFSADLDLATGAEVDSNININGSNLDVSNDALFQADNDFNVNGVAQNSNTRSNNKSSSAAIGGYASTGSGVGITASASKGKGYANSDSVTYANSNINVGNTTTFDIGNDVNIKGGVINTDKIQGAIGGDITIESLQDTATYDSNQKNAGFTLDVALEGAGSSLFVNGGKTNLNSDYKAVGEQSGIFTGDGGFDIAAGGKTTLIGGAITTTEAARDAGRNRYTSADGIKTQDINNTTSYDGNAIQEGVSLGQTDNKPQASMNGLGYGTDSDSDSSITKGGVSGYNDPQGNLTTENREALSGKLDNNFNANDVLKDLNVQVEITKEFRKESFQAINDYTGTRQVDLLKQLETASDEQKTAIYNEIYKLQYQKRLLQTLVGVLAGLPEPAITQGSLQLAATKMRKESLDNSRQSPGVVYTDENGNSQVISNVSYDSGYFDGVKLGGTRLSTDVICGEDNTRCFTDANDQLVTDANGNYIFKGDRDYRTYQSLKDDKKTFKPQIGATGGAQAEQGTLFGFEYNPGGLIDMNIESFAGTHDLLGGQLPGYYGDDGNTKPGDKPFQGIVTGAAIPVAAPFALADLLSPDIMIMLLKLGGNWLWGLSIYQYLQFY